MSDSPMRLLAGALRQNGLVRFIDHFNKLFPDSRNHLKDLVVDRMGPDRIMEVEGRTVVNFGSDSFLGLDQDPRVQEAIRRGVETWGAHNGASRAFSSVRANADAEDKLAAWLGTEATLIYPSVTLANMGAIPGLVGRQDLLVVDEQAHNSIQEGAKIAKANGVRVVTFSHCDPAGLQESAGRGRRLSRGRRGHRRRLQHDRRTAAAGGAERSRPGPPGRAVRGRRPRHRRHRPAGPRHRAGRPGQLRQHAGDRLAVQGLLLPAASSAARTNSSACSRCAPTPTSSAAPSCRPTWKRSAWSATSWRPASTTLLRARLDRNLGHLTNGLKALGLVVSGGVTPIISVLVGDEEDTLNAGQFLFEKGYYVQSVTFPAVPYHAGVLRIQVNANHLPRVDRRPAGRDEGAARRRAPADGLPALRGVTSCHRDHREQSS